MTTDAVRLLAELCEVEPPEISGESIADGRNETGWRLLQRIGALAEIDQAETVLCSACDNPHPVKVELAPVGGYRAYCPDTGWQTIDGTAILRFAVDEQWIANSIRTLIGLKPIEIRPGESLLTRIGRGKFGPYRTELFFARRISERGRNDQVTSSIAGLIGKSPAILFTTTAPDLIRGKLPSRCAVVPLQDVLRVTVGAVTFEEGPVYSALRGPDIQASGSGVGFQFSPGYRSALWSEQHFKFTPKQALAVEALHEAWFNGLPSLHQDEIQGIAETPQRMTELFNGHPAYGTLIRSDQAGHYWLDL